jgi:hypothetical protein
VGTAFTGLLEGFVKTKLTLDEREEKRQKDQADLDLRKQDLDLKRKILEGDRASRQLQDQMHALNIQDLVIKLGKQIRDQDARNALKDPAAPPDATGAQRPGSPPAARRRSCKRPRAGLTRTVARSHRRRSSRRERCDPRPPRRRRRQARSRAGRPPSRAPRC